MGNLGSSGLLASFGASQGRWAAIGLCLVVLGLGALMERSRSPPRSKSAWRQPQPWGSGPLDTHIAGAIARVPNSLLAAFFSHRLRLLVGRPGTSQDFDAVAYTLVTMPTHGASHLDARLQCIGARLVCLAMPSVPTRRTRWSLGRFS